MSSKSSTSVPGYIWLISGLAIGLFVALLVYLGKQPAEKTSFTQAVSKELEKHKSQNTGDNKSGSPNTSKADNKSSREPRFDFYTILPESEVFVPEPATRKPDAVASNQAADTTTSGKQYLLQAGSFRNHSDADNLKANLALLGVTSSIQSVTINTESWHRVRIGPFNNDKTLRDTLATLKNNNIHAMTMELK